MNKVMVFRHDNSDLNFMLQPLDVPDTVNMGNIQTWLLQKFNHIGVVYTVVEVASTVTYTIKHKIPKPSPPLEYCIEEVPEFSIFNHELNGR